jgi:phage tail-like protein
VRRQNDPYGSFNFEVEIQGLIAGGFAEVSGLQAETETEEIREGGVNDYAHRLPKRTKQSMLVLKHGLADSEVLWKWYNDVVQGRVERKNGSVFLRDETQQRVRQWNFFEAYPVKWTGPELRAIGNTVAFESVELIHNRLEMKKP